ncbi:DUF982 domain-containing protein [Mesorhizobium sp. RMAD-H1]|uniref:DUF982 domain-containing protein n=1 Tax=Mesorhizobium sp. RMAD-H1 TaxID=2587065 RepID=UPI0016190D9A|nr:DUF982 domain-containing protein [Mesorhizobium sp. RMAD-H1]
MNRGHFKPVTIELPSDRIGLYRNVSSADEAARLLVEHWPAGAGDKRLAAMQACLDVMEGRADAGIARAAFIAAAHEAKIYVKD